MVKKKSKHLKNGPRKAIKKESAPNAFEQLYNKKRFDVLGRKVKGDVKNTTRLRSEATEKRKKTLLVEYKQLRKSNAFIDRRFGEEDETLTQEERDIYRFQQQRMREMAGSKFSLPEDDDGNGEMLTHLGRSLAELQDAGNGWGSDDDDLGLDAQTTADMNFGGGGLFHRKAPTADGNDEEEEEPARHRSKKEIMEEVIAKSKAYKAMKQQQRDEDLEETEALDDQFTALISAPGFAGLVKPKGQKQSNKADNDDDRAFDVLTKELLYEAKAAPGERTLTAEELAEFERERLEQLEQQRLRRQKIDASLPGGDDEDDFDLDDGEGGIDDGIDLPRGGYAARRAKRTKAEQAAGKRKRRSSGDDDADSDSDDDEDDSGSGDDVLNALEKRRQDTAAGDHPLQQAFRDAAARLLSKHGLKDDDADQSGSSDDEEEDDDDESGSEESGDESDEESESELDDDSQEEGPQCPTNSTVQASTKKKTATTTKDKDLSTMSFTPALPESYEQFSKQVDGLSASDLGEMIRRIRAFNATELNTEGRKKMQMLYGCIVQHFAALSSGTVNLDSLDALLPHIVELTPQVPFYATTLARARLQKAHQRLASCLKDAVLRGNAWPETKTLLLFKLLAIIFPVSDKRHPVITAMDLFIGHALAHCPVTRARDVASGLYLSSTALNIHQEAKRYCHEPLAFAVGLLAASLDGTNTLLKLDIGGSVDGKYKDEESLPRIALQQLLSSTSSSEDYWGSEEFKVAALAAAVHVIERSANVFEDMDAFPEIFAPAISTMSKLIDSNIGNMNGHHHQTNGNGTTIKKKKKLKSYSSSSSGYSQGLLILLNRVLSAIKTKAQAVKDHRKPLSIKALVQLPTVRQFNPRFEEEFALGKDYDPDRERAERRRMERAIKKEERGAMRELRRDGAFMAGVRDKEKASAQNERDISAKKAMSFLQQQEADFKSGGQGGMSWKKSMFKGKKG